MKRYLYIFIATTLILAGACTKTKQTQLRLKIEQVNRECPASLGSTGTLESITYDDNNTAAFTFVLNEDNVNVAGLAGANEEQKEFLANFLRGNDFGRKFLDALVEAEASMRLVYRGNASGDSVVITLTPTELKDIAAEEIGDDTDMLQIKSMLAITNKQCPMKIDEGMTLEGVTVEGNYLVYSYSYDSNTYDFAAADIETIREESTNSLREELTDISGSAQLKLMKSCGLGAKYVYFPDGDREKSATLAIEPETVASF